MTIEHKVELVATVWETSGLAPALAAVDLPKSTWYYHQRQKMSYAEKHAHLHALLEQIAREHPAYGIPRITEELRRVHGQVVNHKVVQRLLRLWDLSLLRSARPPKPSRVQEAIRAAGEQANLVAQMERIGLFEVTYTDFTELVYANGTQKAQLMPILGHCCKLAYGWAVDRRGNTALALQAWERAKTTFQELAIPNTDMVIHHDQDSVYTSYAWIDRLLLQDQVHLSFALNGARDNPEMEAFISRFKTENHSLLLDAADLDELQSVVATQMDYYNTQRRHSSLGYVAPLDYLEQVRSSANDQVETDCHA